MLLRLNLWLKVGFERPPCSDAAQLDASVFQLPQLMVESPFDFTKTILGDCEALFPQLSHSHDDSLVICPLLQHCMQRHHLPARKAGCEFWLRKLRFYVAHFLILFMAVFKMAWASR